MRFQPLPIFRMYRSPVPTCAFDRFSAFRMYCQSIPTCAFDFLPFPHVRLADSYLRFRFPPISACTARRSLHASPLPPRFPHVLPVNPYLRFRPHPVFRTYTPPIPTCAFDLTPSSARTPRRFLHASPTTPRLSHVHPVNPYLHFRFPTAFRTYGSLIPTCASGFLPFSACTAC